MASSTPRGLPGFLRRSMRSDMMMDDGIDNDMNVTPGTGKMRGTTSKEEEVGVRSPTLTSLIPSTATATATASASASSSNAASEELGGGREDATASAAAAKDYKDDDIGHIDRKFRLLKSPATNVQSPTSEQYSESNKNGKSHTLESSTTGDMYTEEHQRKYMDPSNIETSNSNNGEGGKKLFDSNQSVLDSNKNHSLHDSGNDIYNNNNNHENFIHANDDPSSPKSATLPIPISPQTHTSPIRSTTPVSISVTSSSQVNTRVGTGTGSNKPLTSTSTQEETKSGNADSVHQNSTLPPKIKTNGSPSSKSKKRHMNYKETEFEKAITEPVVNIAALRKLGWNGIPAQHRPQAWKLLLGYLPTNKTRRTQTLKRKRLEYLDIIKQHYDISDDTRTNSEQETLRQVLVDVPRTAPDVPLFRNDLVRQSLSRLLYIWACRHPASSYVQGINDLATPLIAVFLSEFYDNQHQFFKDDKNTNSSSNGNGGNNSNVHASIHDGSVLDGSVMDDLSLEDLQNVEADVYWCLTNLLAGIQDHYTSDQPGVQRMVMRLEDLVNRMDGELTEHLRSVGVEFIQFAFRWMNCLLLREFKLDCVIRLWDTYLSEGDGAGFAMGFETFHVYVCAAFLCQFSGLLRNMEFDELFGFMQNVPTSDWGDSEVEILLSQAFVLSTLFHGSDAHLTGQNR